MRQVLLMTFTFLWLTACSQSVTGKIIDADSKNPLQYVNIGVVGRNIGTVCDKNGSFALEIPEYFDKDTLRISIIGFHPNSYKVEDFKRVFQESIGGLIIELTKKTLVLPEVFVTSREFTEKESGSKGKLGRIDFYSAKDTTLGGEVGTVIKVKRANAFVQNIHVVIKANTYDDSILFRLNLYSMNGEIPGENILREPIYVSTKIKKGILIVNLEKYNIYVENDFLASLEWIELMGEKKIGFGWGFKGKSFMRVTSEGEWDKVPLGMGIGIFATLIYVK